MKVKRDVISIEIAIICYIKMKRAILKLNNQYAQTQQGKLGNVTNPVLSQRA